MEYANELKSTFSEGIEIGYFSLRLSFASFLWVACSLKDKEKKPRKSCVYMALDVIVSHAVALILCLINLRLALTRLIICSWYSVF